MFIYLPGFGDDIVHLADTKKKKWQCAKQYVHTKKDDLTLRSSLLPYMNYKIDVPPVTRHVPVTSSASSFRLWRRVCRWSASVTAFPGLVNLEPVGVRWLHFAKSAPF